MTTGIELQGGPMDRWVARPDAPVLDPHWSDTWPVGRRTLLSRLMRRPTTIWPRPGRYVLDPGGKTARWVEG